MVKKIDHFELQLVVIGILIPLYLEILPKIIRPIQFYFNFSMEMPMIFSYLMGSLWFVCLLFGTSTLAFNGWLKEKSVKIYHNLFEFNNILTGTCIVILVIAYLTVFLILFLQPLFPDHPFITLSTTSLIILGLTVLIIYILMRNKKKRGRNNVKKK